ncbi:MAG: cation-translocating P-type ATPase [Chloroflexota bacterium]
MANENEQQYFIGNMDCANCAKEVENGVKRLAGIEAVEVSFSTNKMILQGNTSYETIKERVEALGKTIAPYSEGVEEETADFSEHSSVLLNFLTYLRGKSEFSFTLTGLLLMLMGVIGNLFGLDDRLISGTYIIGMLIMLRPILWSGLNGLRINRQFNINMLMSIAAIGALIIGEYFESALVIFLFTIGESLEGFAAHNARRSIRSLMQLKPKTAVLITSTSEKEVAVEQLKIGDQILIKPGENVPMDGRIIQGESSVNQAPITGESIPVDKKEGDSVFASSLNGTGAIIVEITHLAKDNTVNRIIRLVEEAQSNQANAQRLIDHFASWYTPAVMGLALLVATVPPLFFNAPFFDTAEGQGWLYRSLAMLVIACPCALVISTPVTVISAITAATKRGVLIKGGSYLEALGRINAFAFDKTGTLTQGVPEVVHYQGIDCQIEPDCSNCDEVLALASAIERQSAHPLAKAVVKKAHQRQLGAQFGQATAVTQLMGLGIQGKVGSDEILIGSHALFDEKIPHSDALCEEIQAVEAKGETAVLLAQNGQTRGFISIADTPRESAQAVIQTLNALDISTVMLTGDHEQVAQKIGADVGVTKIRAGLLPEDKLTAVQELNKQYQRIGMVGDGINDTPALAAATVGIAMGGAGSPQALETADVVLMADDLTKLPYAIQLSRFAFKIIRQNVIISFAVKAIFLILAFFGLTSLWVAILADMGMSLLVTTNGMRPLKFDAQPKVK